MIRKINFALCALLICGGGHLYGAAQKKDPEIVIRNDTKKYINVFYHFRHVEPGKAIIREGKYAMQYPMEPEGDDLSIPVKWLTKIEVNYGVGKRSAIDFPRSKEDPYRVLLNTAPALPYMIITHDAVHSKPVINFPRDQKELAAAIERAKERAKQEEREALADQKKE